MSHGAHSEILHRQRITSCGFGAQADGWNCDDPQALLTMGEKSSTPQARRAVAKLIERYFVALKRQLTEQTAAFWARVESAIDAKVRDDKSNENKEVKNP